MAHFYAFLLTSHSLPLIILKKVDFVNLSKKMIIFLQLLLCEVLTTPSSKLAPSVFGDLLSPKPGGTKSIAKKIDIFGSDMELEEHSNNDGAEEQLSFEEKNLQDLLNLKAGINLFIRTNLRNPTPPFVKNPSLLEQRIELFKTFLDK